MPTITNDKTIKNSTNKSVLVLLAAVLIELCLGSGFGWSVFVKPLMALHGWTRSQVTLTFSVSLLFNGIGYLLVGYWADHHPRRAAVTGGILFGTGIALAGLFAHLGWRYPMYLCYGAMGGFGISLPYLAALSVAIKRFPLRRGLAAGIVVMGCGSGAVLVGIFAPRLIERFGPGVTLMGMGMLFCLVCGSLGMVLTNPPRLPSATPIPARGSLIPWEVLKIRKFWGLWTIQFFFMAAGTALFSQAAPMAQELQQLTPFTAGKLVAMMAICNGFGRVFWSSISDRLGRRKILITLFISQALAFLTLAHIPNFWLFGIVFCYIPFCYGGCCGTMPAFTADLFGPEKVACIYGPVISAQAVAGLAGPLLFSGLREALGSYTLPTHLTGLALLVLSALPLLIGRKPTTSPSKSS
jgi:MFS transporter, OFA family, oxalate/formate antiporter